MATSPQPAMRVVPPMPPYAPNVQAIPSTVTTPTRGPSVNPSRNLSRNPSFGHRGVVAGADEGGPRCNSSFVSAAGVYVTAPATHVSLRAPSHSSDGRSSAAPSAADDGHADGRPAEDGEGEEVVRPVDKRPAMLGYFGYMFGCAAINAYFGVILKQKGFSVSVVGILVSCSPLFQIFLLPWLSFIADKHHCSIQMLCLSAVGATATVLSLTLSGEKAIVLVSFLALSAFQTPMNSLLDKHTLLMFPPVGRTAAWGYVRSYGAYGWGIGNPIAGLAVKWAGTWAVGALQYALGQVALLYCMRVTKPYEALSADGAAPVRFKDVLSILVRNRRLLLFLLASCLMGMGYSFINNFLFIFLGNLGASEFLMGLSVTVTVSTEIPIFQYSDHLHEYFTERQMLTLSMAIWMVRVVGYSFLYNPWLVLLLEPLHGVTFALMWLPGVKLISEVFPPELSSSATGVLFTFVNGIGAIVGNLAAGVLTDLVGARWTFRIAAIMMAVGLAVYYTLDRYLESAGYTLGKRIGGASSGATASSPTSATDVVVESKEFPAETSVSGNGRERTARRAALMEEGVRIRSARTAAAGEEVGDEELPAS